MGMVGIVNGRTVVSGLIDGLRNLQNRDHEWAGIAISDRNALHLIQTRGPIDSLAARCAGHPIDGPAGLAQTRTAGAHPLPNSKPRPMVAEGVAVAQDGVVENIADLRAKLEEDGICFHSKTDGDVLPHLLAQFRKEGMTALEAVRRASLLLDGQVGLGVLFDDEPRTLFAAGRECRLTLGTGPEKVYLASDPNGFAGRMKETLSLDSGEVARVRRDGVQILGRQGDTLDRSWTDAVPRSVSVPPADQWAMMHKEIHQQPAAVALTLNVSRSAPITEPAAELLTSAPRLSVVATGPSLHAGMIAGSWLERYAGLPADLHDPGQADTGTQPVASNGVGLFISRSGEAECTVACLRDAQRRGVGTAAIVNTQGSTLATEADLYLPVMSGPEVGIAPTKAFTGQLAALMGLTRTLAAERRPADETALSRFDMARAVLPALIEDTLDRESSCASIADAVRNSSRVLWLGRGSNRALAMHGAFQLKTICGIESAAIGGDEPRAGEADNMAPPAAIVIAPRDDTFQETAAVVEALSARNGRVVLLSDEEGCEQLAASVWKQVVLPETDDLTAPFIYAAALQFITYHLAMARGSGVDRLETLSEAAA